MQIGETRVFQEMLTLEDGACYDVIEAMPWGYKHLKLYSHTRDKAKIDEMISEEGFSTDYSYEPTELKDEREYIYTETIKLRSENTEELMQQLYDIEQLGNMRVHGQTSEEFTVTYYFSFLIYEIKNMSVKIPIRTESNGEVRWSFEYLIYPNFTVNYDVMNKVRKISKNEELALNIEGISSHGLNRGISRTFSAAGYSYLQKEYMLSCNEAKGIVNAIRTMEHYESASSHFYEIFQNSRINKKELIAYKGFVYMGNDFLSKELPFKDYIGLLGLDIATISNITKDKEKFQDFIDENKDSIAHQPVLLYMQNLDNPFEAMDTYEVIEKHRAYSRKLKYQMNMALYDAMPYVRYYLEYTFPIQFTNTPHVDPIFLEELGWNRGGHIGYEGFKSIEYKPRKNRKVKGF